jgi:uncharacterized membrane-anchored protein YjiN (DUF445 family)
LNKFEYGNAHRTDVNFDQTNRRMLNTPRILAFQLADYLIRNNRKEDAKKVIKKVINSVSESSYPSVITQEDRSMILMADMSMKAGDKELAKKITDKLVKFCQDDVAYINSLKENLRDSKYPDAQFEFQALGYLSQSASTNGMPELGKELAEKVNMLAQQLPQMPRQ